MGAQKTWDLGIYLGHRIWHTGRNKDAHNNLLQRVRSHLDGWKSKTLSTEGRITLDQSVLNSMAIFQMQLQWLPSRVHKELDRIVKSCIWGEREGKRKVHLVNRDVLCRPKDRGGVRLMKSEAMNKALLTKLVWRLTNQGEETWTRVLKAKCGLAEEGVVYFNYKQQVSATWKGRTWCANLLHEGMHWTVINGRRARFWSDKWLDDKPLMLGCRDSLEEDELQWLAYKFWEAGQSWK